METLSSREYETREDSKQGRDWIRLQTSGAGVEHNGVMDLEAKRLPAEHAQPTGPAEDMRNELLVQPDSDSVSAASLSRGHELDAFLGKAFDEKPLWTGLYENVRDFFFPPHLP